MNAERFTLRRRVILWVAVLAITLFAGLQPEDYDFRNHASPSADGGGLEFERYGVAFTPPFLTEGTGGEWARRGLTITLTIGSEAARQDGFALIAQVRAADDRSQLIIGRWRDHIIVMNGDDYDGRLGWPRISARSTPSGDESRTITVTSGPGGTRLFVDGRLAGERHDLRLRVPRDPPGGRIVLGNSVSGTHSWKGVIRDFALYERTLGAEEIVSPPAPGSTIAPSDPRGESGLPVPSEPKGPRVQYTMDDLTPGDPGIVPSRGSDRVALVVPRRRVIVERQYFRNPFSRYFDPNRGFAIDFAVNLLGLIPFGVALSLLLGRVGVRGFRALFIVMAAAAMLSGGIETIQAWLPSRTSSLLDLTLNIASGGLGALFVVLGRRSPPPTSP